MRKAFGVGAAALVDRGGMRVAWISANWGSLPLSGGIEAGSLNVLFSEKLII